MKKMLVALFVLCAVSVFGQSYSTMEIENFRYNWQRFRCDSVATASADVDTLVLPAGIIANLTVYCYAAEAKIKIGLRGNNATNEWLRIAAAGEFPFPGLFKPDTIFYVGTGTGSLRITYTIF